MSSIVSLSCIKLCSAAVAFPFDFSILLLLLRAQGRDRASKLLTLVHCTMCIVQPSLAKLTF